MRQLKTSRISHLVWITRGHTSCMVPREICHQSYSWISQQCHSHIWKSYGCFSKKVSSSAPSQWDYMWHPCQTHGRFMKTEAVENRYGSGLGSLLQTFSYLKRKLSLEKAQRNIRTSNTWWAKLMPCLEYNLAWNHNFIFACKIATK